MQMGGVYSCSERLREQGQFLSVQRRGGAIRDTIRREHRVTVIQAKNEAMVRLIPLQRERVRATGTNGAKHLVNEVGLTTTELICALVYESRYRQVCARVRRIPVYADLGKDITD